MEIRRETHITIDGQTYSSVDQMPTEVRARYEQAMSLLADRDGNGVPDALEGVVPASRDGVVTQVSGRFIINGREVGSLSDFRAALQAPVDEAAQFSEEERKQFEATARKDFRLPPRTVTRKSGLASAIALRLFAAAIVIVWTVFVVDLGEAVLTDLAGANVAGRVEWLNSYEGGKHTRHYEVRYSFVGVDGKRISEKRELDHRWWRDLHVGDTVPVKTMTIFGRAVHVLDVEFLDSTRTGEMVGIFFATFLGAVTIYAAWLTPRRQRRILQDGQITLGRVMKVSTASRSGDLNVKYAYAAPEGVARTGKATVAKRNGTPSTLIGRAITVFYDPQKPQQSVAYEFCDFEAW